LKTSRKKNQIKRCILTFDFLAVNIYNDVLILADFIKVIHEEDFNESF